jgi:hypothetical protein
LPIFFRQKINIKSVGREKLQKTLSYKKSAHKMLVKLTFLEEQTKQDVPKDDF